MQPGAEERARDEQVADESPVGVVDRALARGHREVRGILGGQEGCVGVEFAALEAGRPGLSDGGHERVQRRGVIDGAVVAHLRPEALG